MEEDAAISYAKGQGKQFEKGQQRRRSGELAFERRESTDARVGKVGAEYEWDGAAGDADAGAPRMIEGEGILWWAISVVGAVVAIYLYHRGM